MGKLFLIKGLITENDLCIAARLVSLHRRFLKKERIPLIVITRITVIAFIVSVITAIITIDK